MEMEIQHWWNKKSVGSSDVQSYKMNLVKEKKRKKKERKNKSSQDICIYKSKSCICQRGENMDKLIMNEYYSLNTLHMGCCIKSKQTSVVASMQRILAVF